jgi:hypothetical protein
MGCLWLHYGGGILSTLSTSPFPCPIVFYAVLSCLLQIMPHPLSRRDQGCTGGQLAILRTAQLPLSCGTNKRCRVPHFGTFTPAVTFDATSEHLDQPLTLGMTHAELLPVPECAGNRG